MEDECRAGDVSAALDRLAVLHSIPRLEISGLATDLAERIINQHALPPKAAKDALHVAIAAAHGVHFLLTWNCTHLNNGEIYPRVKALCEASGCSCPVIVTPAELMGTHDL